MVRLSTALSSFQTAVLDHVRRGHASNIDRAVKTSKHTVGGLQLTGDAMAELAVKGCNVCNAYKIKLMNPRQKEVAEETPGSSGKLLMYYDSFGRVSVASAQFGYHYAHMFHLPEYGMAWLRGSNRLDEHTVGSMWFKP